MLSLISVCILLKLIAATHAVHTFSYDKVPYIEDIGERIRPFYGAVDPEKWRSPVILIPGMGGSRMEAKLNKSDTVRFLCTKTTETFYDIWLAKEFLLPLAIDCLVDNLRLVYNNKTRIAENSPGVRIVVSGWGYPENVEWLCRTQDTECAYYTNLAEALVSQGYDREVSLYAAPYDFRQAPEHKPIFNRWLKSMVEGAYDVNSNTSVTLVAHSMGGPMVLDFLHQQPQEWKDKYIRRLISLNAAWGGTVKSMKAYAYGDNLDTMLVDREAMRAMQITTPSLAWMMPSPLFWKPQTVLMKTKTKTYTVENYQEFFEDIDYPTGWEMRKDAMSLVMNFSAPGVEVHCLFGTSVPTIEQLDYGEAYELTGTPEFVYGNGDGTINAISLEACQHWVSLQKQPVVVKKYPNVGHMQILGDMEVLNDVIEIQRSDLE